jgi:hypothetical protein
VPNRTVPQMMQHLRDGLPGVKDHDLSVIAAMMLALTESNISMTLGELEEQMDLLLVQYGFPSLYGQAN